MSGIEKIVNQMRSKKMTLDDLPVPTTEVAKKESSLNPQTEKKSNQSTVCTSVQTDVHTAVQPAVHTASHTAVQHADTVIQQNSNSLGGVGGVEDYKREHVLKSQNGNTEVQQAVFAANTAKQQTSVADSLRQESVNNGSREPFPQPKKVTYYIAPEMFKAFNDVYAKRILEGRKTDKSTLISEAVELLYLSEMNR